MSAAPQVCHPLPSTLPEFRIRHVSAHNLPATGRALFLALSCEKGAVHPKSDLTRALKVVGRVVGGGTLWWTRNGVLSDAIVRAAKLRRGGVCSSCQKDIFDRKTALQAQTGDMIVPISPVDPLGFSSEPDVAYFNGDISGLKQCLSNGGSDIDSTNERNLSAIWASLSVRNVRSVAFLASQGANLDALCPTPGHEGQVPVVWAATCGFDLILELLLNLGCNPNSHTTKAAAPAASAASAASAAPAASAASAASATSATSATSAAAAIHNAVAWGHLRCLQRLLRGGYSVAFDLVGSESDGSFLEYVNALPKPKTDTNEKDGNFHTPLYIALRSAFWGGRSSTGEPLSISLLLRHGAKIKSEVREAAKRKMELLVNCPEWLERLAGGQAELF